MKVIDTIQLADLREPLSRVFDLAGQKIKSIEDTWNPDDGTPVFTVEGKYTTRGWTEWTQGFQFGCAVLQYDATDDASFLEIGRKATVDKRCQRCCEREATATLRRVRAIRQVVGTAPLNPPRNTSPLSDARSTWTSCWS